MTQTSASSASAPIISARTSAQILVDQLVLHGAHDIFAVPGESFLAVLDALVDTPLRLTICRQEGGAAMMAEAQGKLTNRPGICFVTRGPGAMNAAHAVHIAQQDSTPMILFIGQIDRSFREREAFQEMDYRAVFGSFAKWATEIEDGARIPELISRAYHVATSGRMGPVVIALPEDMLQELHSVQDAPPMQALVQDVSLSQMEALSARIAAAKSPFVVLGGSGWDETSVADMVRFSEAFDIPVAVSLRRQMLFPMTHPHYAGDVGIGANPALLKRVRESDCLILIGARMGEMPSQGYELLPIPGSGENLIHIHADPNELQRVYATNLPICARPQEIARALAALKPPAKPLWQEKGQEKRQAQTVSAHQDYLQWSTPHKKLSGDFQYGEVMAWLSTSLPKDAILTNGAGNYATWLHRFFRFKGYGTQAAPTSGSMGYGVPAAIGLKRLYPERVVIAFAGDGCFMMNGQEFATAVQYGIHFIAIVIDNGMYGTIRMHQEKHYPARISGTKLINPDFAALARAYGGHGETVHKTEEFAPAFQRAVESGKPAIIHCFLDPEAITPLATLTDLREAALKAKG